MENEYQLPPLPEPRIVSYQTDSTMRSMELRTYDESDMRGFARAAFAQARHEALEEAAQACISHSELCDEIRSFASAIKCSRKIRALKEDKSHE